LCFASITHSYINQSLPNASDLWPSINAITGFYTAQYLVQIDGGSYDDLLWWALAYIRLFEQTQDSKYLKQSIYIFEYVYKNSWDDSHCGGGFWWSDRKK
jgi:hypothetical protein